MVGDRQIPLFKAHVPDNVCEALKPVFSSGYLADGLQVGQFEDLLKTYVGNPNLAAMSDVSGAVTLALFMAGVRPGDEVIISPMCCTATTMPIANLFARPVWCDVDPKMGMMDINRIPDLITEKTKAILVYHWSGDVSDVDAIKMVARSFELKTIDDASEGFGAEYKGNRLGNNGMDFTAYSFHAVKHITTGEGGALFFANAEDFEHGQWLKRYGIHRPTFRLTNGDLNDKSDIPVAGYNFYMNNLAATIGIQQFAYVDMITRRHRENGRFYEGALKDIPGVQLLSRHSSAVSAYWTYSLLVEQRNDLINKLGECGVGSQRLHVRNDLYGCFNPVQRELPGVDCFDQHNVSIPCGWWVTDEDRAYIVNCIRSGW